MRSLRTHLFAIATITSLSASVLLADQPTKGNGNAAQSNKAGSAIQGGSTSGKGSGIILGDAGKVGGGKVIDPIKPADMGKKTDLGGKINPDLLQGKGKIDPIKPADMGKKTDLGGKINPDLLQGKGKIDPIKPADLGKKSDLGGKINPDLLGKGKLDPVKPGDSGKIDLSKMGKVDPIQKGSLGQLKIVEKSKLDSVQLSKLTNPGLKLNPNAKVDVNELAKIKPMIDLNKIKPVDVINNKPNQKFDIKPIALNKLHIPTGTASINKLSFNAGLAKSGFIMNTAACIGGANYFHNHAVRCATGWCYAGAHHHHWHHCVWDASFGCHYYFCPSASCYFYYCESAACYYPCYWFVDYCDSYYPWWLCGGGFAHHGYYHSGISIDIHIGL